MTSAGLFADSRSSTADYRVMALHFQSVWHGFGASGLAGQYNGKCSDHVQTDTDQSPQSPVQIFSVSSGLTRST